MRKVFVLMWSALFLGGLISCVSSGDSSRWELVWEDDFNGTSFDTATWSKIPRANPEWARHMSDNEACYEMRDGNLVLKGIVNTDLENDTAPYITGGVYTKLNCRVRKVLGRLFGSNLVTRLNGSGRGPERSMSWSV